MEKAKYRRRNYFIKKRFQLKYTIAMVALLLAVMLASGIGLYLGMWGSIIENFSKFKVSENLENVKRITDYEEARFSRGDYRLDKIFREAELLSQKDEETLAGALRSVNRSLVPKAAVLMAVIFLAGIFISHKIAGPMYRIEKSANAIHEGNLSVNFNLRKTDDMKETASALEEMVESLREDIKKMKSTAIFLEEKITAIERGVSRDNVSSAKALVGDLNAILSKYKT